MALNAESPISIVLPEFPNHPDVKRTKAGYVGKYAGEVGRLAAAVHVAVSNDDVFLHYPKPVYSVTGPWFVLEPLNGRIATVHKGRGQATVTMAYRDPQAPDTPALFKNCLQIVRAASDVSHPIYPTREIFTIGMTTFTIDEVKAGSETLTATFTVSTIPSTTAEDIEARFNAVDCVKEVDYETMTDFAHATPSATVREPVEHAHTEVLEDLVSAFYVWFPEPTVFSEIPALEKIAFGMGEQGAQEFPDEQYAKTVRLLAKSIQGIGDEQ
jgi:hypothetical protein